MSRSPRAGGPVEPCPSARPCDVAWIRSIIGQCKAAQVSCFVKQLGARPIIPAHEPWTCLDRKGGDMAEWPEDLRVREWPDTGGKERGA
jgi:protein gp37